MRGGPLLFWLVRWLPVLLHFWFVRWLLVFLLTIAAGACTSPSQQSGSQSARPQHRDAVNREPLSPLGRPPRIDARLVSLGRRLFEDKRLSSDDTIACSSCHDLASGGDDGQSLSRGVQGRVGHVNAPTVFNASLNFALFWDGRAKTLEEQVDGPVTNPLEMNSAWNDVIVKLVGDASYVRLFREAFDDGPASQHVREAIAAFERTLLTPDSPFDRWLVGDSTAMSADQKEGYETFKNMGCIACHQGVNVGGNMFQRFGVLGDYFKDRGNISVADYGRFNVTHNEADRHVFRVPSLRNVEQTAPYFHDGSAQTLRQAIAVMAQYQLGRTLSDRQVEVIEAFLRSLSGQVAQGTAL
jgi:cytochrome c peroxidase